MDVPVTGNVKSSGDGTTVGTGKFEGIFTIKNFIKSDNGSKVLAVGVLSGSVGKQNLVNRSYRTS
ncbi:hypothetical protein [Nitrosomonas sp. Nm166]|uniref:hypothetical protein n=1 Tax=Nitrosomonas sp. Nm166 TaxID=1881054 RepID=UPI000B819E1C|nr:hypothetical protein [Nitrosomonas sp. Nm166]